MKNDVNQRKAPKLTIRDALAAFFLSLCKFLFTNRDARGQTAAELAGSSCPAVTYLRKVQGDRQILSGIFATKSLFWVQLYQLSCYFGQLTEKWKYFVKIKKNMISRLWLNKPIPNWKHILLHLLSKSDWWFKCNGFYAILNLWKGCQKD